MSSARIERFKEASRLRGADQPPCAYAQNLNDYWEQHADLPLRERQARARAHALANLPVHLLPDERLVGMVYHCGPAPKVADPTNYWPRGHARAAQEVAENADLVQMGLLTDGGYPGHVTWHWDRLLALGVEGLIARHREALNAAPDQEARDFHGGVLISLEALLSWNARHVAALRAALAAAGDAAERPRLAELVSLCERVPARPARTFREAVQGFYFQHLAVMRECPFGGNGPGRLDYYLWPYLERDLAEGRTSLEEARELIDELFIRLHERIQPWDGWVEGVMAGGCRPDGSPSVNPLSRIMIESIMDLAQTHPSVYVRIPADAPADFVRLAARYLREGGNLGQVLSDRAIIRALALAGVPAQDAAMYACGGCMEITPQGMASDMNFTGTHNVPKLVELALTGGVCLKTGRRLAGAELPGLERCTSFEQLYDSFARELQRELSVMFRRLDIYSEAMAHNRPLYLMSSMVDDCTARGREMHDGGARHHHYGIAPLGIPNAADALYAVKAAVFDDRTCGRICTAAELMAALRADFEGREDLRRRLRALPKYGWQHPEADAMADRVLRTVCDVHNAWRGRNGSRVKPMIFTFVWAPETGRALGATADGQFAGRPIAQGLTPQAAGLSRGITAAIGSHTRLSLERVTGGATTMWDLDPAWADVSVVEQLLQTFIALGGMIFQGNMTDVEDLILARRAPGDYPNLIVRVGGYSARFVTLSAELQDEIISRYRHRAGRRTGDHGEPVRRV